MEIDMGENEGAPVYRLRAGEDSGRYVRVEGVAVERQRYASVAADHLPHLLLQPGEEHRYVARRPANTWAQVIGEREDGVAIIAEDLVEIHTWLTRLIEEVESVWTAEHENGLHLRAPHRYCPQCAPSGWACRGCGEAQGQLFWSDRGLAGEVLPKNEDGPWVKCPLCRAVYQPFGEESEHYWVLVDLDGNYGKIRYANYGGAKQQAERAPWPVAVYRITPYGRHLVWTPEGGEHSSIVWPPVKPGDAPPPADPVQVLRRTLEAKAVEWEANAQRFAEDEPCDMDTVENGTMSQVYAECAAAVREALGKD